MSSTYPVRDIARVTVTEPVEPFFKRSERARTEPSPLGHVKPHPAVWARAKELAGGDAYRLVVESATSVLVLNKPRWSAPRSNELLARGAR